MDEMRFRVREMRHGSRPEWRFVAWCAQTDALGDGPLDVDWLIDCWFEYGETAEQALRKLKAEVLN